jgi:chemotaxis protein methyltransferase CheR
MSQRSMVAGEPTDAQLGALRDLLAGYCGVYLDDTRQQVLRGAIRRRTAQTGQSSAAYVAALATPGQRGELQQLAELLLNHETIFFRNRPHMEALRSTILPELARRLPPGEPIRIWSAGCATGEEPYSIAIAALEALGEPPTRPIEILATDLSAAALTRAQAGVYRGRSLSYLSGAQRGRYFSPRGDGLAVAPALRRLVRFEQRNLLDPFALDTQGVHAIFCQNVTIYFQVATCRALMERFYAALAEGGLLFLGFSETLWNIFNRFRWREVSGTYVYYKESKPAQAAQAALPATAPLAPPPAGRPQPTPQPGAGRIERGRELLNAGQADEALELLYARPVGGELTPQLLALAAQAHANRGDFDLAAAEARRALELDPLTTEAHLLIGMIYARQGQPTEAIVQLERARYLDAAAPLISFHLAECYRQAGRSDRALSEYRTALRKLAAYQPDQMLDGVAVAWLSATCRRYVSALSSG